MHNKKRLIVVMLVLIMTVGIQPGALAAGQEEMLGFVNVPYVLQHYPGLNDILQQINNEKVSLQNKFNEQAQTMPEEERNKLSLSLAQELANFEKGQMAPVQQNIQQAIAKAAKKRNIKSVVNSTAMLLGGIDLTEDIVKVLQE